MVQQLLVLVKMFLQDLKGRVVLLDFWTYCCINCMHVLPDLEFVEKKYKEKPVSAWFVFICFPDYVCAPPLNPHPAPPPSPPGRTGRGRCSMLELNISSALVLNYNVQNIFFFVKLDIYSVICYFPCLFCSFSTFTTLICGYSSSWY